MGITITAPDHRAGAHGDQQTVAVDSVRAAHALARDLNAGIYTVSIDGDSTVYESDGATYWPAASESLRLAPIPARVFNEMGALGFDRGAVTAIAERAMRDQQAGITVMRGRDQYTTTPERITYQQAWLASMTVNGPASPRVIFRAPGHVVSLSLSVDDVTELCGTPDAVSVEWFGVTYYRESR